MLPDNESVKELKNTYYTSVRESDIKATQFLGPAATEAALKKSAEKLLKEGEDDDAVQAVRKKKAKKLLKEYEEEQESKRRTNRGAMPWGWKPEE